MLAVKYFCQDCGEESSDDYDGMICEYCGGRLKGSGAPGITGTRDGFGIKKAFRDDETGEKIDNWKTWEKRGYRNPLEVTKSGDMKERIKDNIKKRRSRNNG